MEKDLSAPVCLERTVGSKMLSFHMTHCCGVNEISNLSLYGNNPKGAMANFCEQNITKPGQVKYGSYAARDNTLYAFYYFTAGVHQLDNRVGTCYGFQFAKFIEDNKLGEVTTLPPKANAGWHPGRWAQVWIWSPNLEALKAWYQVNKVVV